MGIDTVTTRGRYLDFLSMSESRDYGRSTYRPTFVTNVLMTVTALKQSVSRHVGYIARCY